MKMNYRKIIKYVFAAYNFFLAIVAAFDLFQFPRKVLLLLLLLEALQVGLYKLYDAYTIKQETPSTHSPMQVTVTPLHFIRVKNAVRNHAYIHDVYKNEIQIEIARGIGKELLNQHLIDFDEKVEGDFVITTGEIQVAEKNN